MKRFLMWSGGKDSSASLIICHELGIPIDAVIFSEVMFDHSRGISGEHPRFIRWVYDKAIPKIEEMGYKVIVLRDQSDYIQEFYRIPNCRKPERAGKHQAFLWGGKCVGNRNLKLRPIKRFLKSIQEPYEEIVGIAVDEPIRVHRLNCSGKRSVLVEQGIEENDTYDFCRRYGLLAPTYDTNTRSGCWFCPNASIRCFFELRRDYPELWNELVKLSQTPNLISYGFKYGKTVQEVEAEMDRYGKRIENELEQIKFDI